MDEFADLSFLLMTPPTPAPAAGVLNAKAAALIVEMKASAEAAEPPSAQPWTREEAVAAVAQAHAELARLERMTKPKSTTSEGRPYVVPLWAETKKKHTEAWKVRLVFVEKALAAFESIDPSVPPAPAAGTLSPLTLSERGRARLERYAQEDSLARAGGGGGSNG